MGIEVFDSHLHIGMLSDDCIIHPNEVLSFVGQHNVVGGLLMPTACINGGDNLSLYNILYKEAIEQGFCVALYVNRQVLSLYKKGLLAEYPYSALKIHLEAVGYNEEELDDICKMAYNMKLPLLVHTSNYPSCKSMRFERIIKRNPHQVFILCHGRPSEDALSLMSRYDNVWIDTAFLSVDNLERFVLQGFEDRILFGSDYPINRWFINNDEALWYQSLIDVILNTFSESVASKILRDNYVKMFNNLKLTIWDM